VYRQVLDPVGDSLLASSPFAILPIATLFVLLGGLKLKAHLASLIALAAANSSGGVLGEMISPQNLAIGAAAVGLGGQEGDLFRRVLGWSLALLLIMCVLVYLQSTAVLSWMVV
jgi:L-lactate permease